MTRRALKRDKLMGRAVLFLLTLTFQAFGLQAGEDIFRVGLPAEKVMLGCLDKVTARVSTVEAVVGEVTAFGNLKIMVRKAEKSRPEDPPETTAFLEILEDKPNEPVAIVFRGWMFASTPSASAMEHPVYDVWIKDSVSSKDKEAHEALPEPPKGRTASPEALSAPAPKSAIPDQATTASDASSKKRLDTLLEELEEMEIPDLGGIAE